MVTVWIVTLLVLAAAIFAERVHARRVRRVARLAFGPVSRPAVWARGAPVVRVLGLAGAVWGALVLARYDPVGGDETPSARASRQLLIALDVSPSMLIKDAGPDTEKVTRSQWAGKVVEGILDRVDMKQTRITLIAFYTKALTVLEDCTDKNVIRNMFDGLQLHVAFEPGPTDLAAGVNEALKVARPWARRSTTLVVVSDGDAKGLLTGVSLPPAIADSIVIGVGDPNHPSLVSGHSSKQETLSLRQLASRLGGYYHNGNRLQLPSDVLRKLTMITPGDPTSVGLREAGLIALALGASMTAFIGPLLLFLGTPRAYARDRRPVGESARRLSKPLDSRSAA